MRLLCLSNFYPPQSMGGYEQWCQEVTERLRARGHEVHVLTSDFGTAGLPPSDPPWVRRELRLEMEFAALGNAVRFFTSRRADERRTLDRLRAAVSQLNPDGIVIWGMWNLPRSIPVLAEQLRPNRVAYYVGDYWPTLPSQFEPYWSSPARSWMAAILKAPLRVAARRALAREVRPPIEFRHAMFPTAFMRDELSRRGVVAEVSQVVPGGIDTSLYAHAVDDSPTTDDGPVRLLWAGRLTPDKGAHTAVEALAELVYARRMSQATLTIVGAGEPSYERRLAALATALRVDSSVRIVGPQPKGAMPRLYREADVFVFTSIWAEPFGRVLVEAMASGLAVVGTRTGGAAEILTDGVNALVFEPEDATGLADRIARLVGSPVLRREIAEQGRRGAQRFDIGRMTSEIEAFVQQMVAGAGWPQQAAAAARSSLETQPLSL